MNIDKEKILKLAKDRGLDLAEETLEDICHLGLDIVKELANFNPLASGIVSSLEPTIREAIDKIDLDKDGQ